MIACFKDPLSVVAQPTQHPVPNPAFSIPSAILYLNLPVFSVFIPAVDTVGGAPETQKRNRATEEGKMSDTEQDYLRVYLLNRLPTLFWAR